MSRTLNQPEHLRTAAKDILPGDEENILNKLVNYCVIFPMALLLSLIKGNPQGREGEMEDTFFPEKDN